MLKTVKVRFFCCCRLWQSRRGWGLVTTQTSILCLCTTASTSPADGKERDRWTPICSKVWRSVLFISSRPEEPRQNPVWSRYSRPSGASGLLVSPADAFDEYQHNDAWTWEHQAHWLELVWSMVMSNWLPHSTKHVWGVVSITWWSNVEKAVVDMRGKNARDHLGGKKAERFMLKQDAGGIADVEFLAQYLVLRYSHEKPADTLVWQCQNLWESDVTRNQWTSNKAWHWPMHTQHYAMKYTIM